MCVFTTEKGFIFNMDEQFGFEDFQVSGANRPGPKPDAQTSTESPDKNSEEANNAALAIAFSSKVVQALKAKARAHNKDNPSRRVTTAQLKKVYRSGANAFSQDCQPEMARGNWAMARVNMFLRMKGDSEAEESYKKADQDSISINFSDLKFEEEIEVANSSIFDLTDQLNPSSEDVSQSNIDVDLYKLDYDFQNIDELYLDDYQPLGFAGEWE